MAQVIAWRFDTGERRFILKFSNRRVVKVRTINAILGMEERVQREILHLGVPMANVCERTQTVIRRLKRKFEDNNDDDDVDDDLLEIPTVTSWCLDEQRMVKITYSAGHTTSMTMNDVLTTPNLSLLEQLCNLPPSDVRPLPVMTMFRSMMRGRFNERMALYANVNYDDESEQSDEQSDGYISDVIPSDEDY